MLRHDRPALAAAVPCGHCHALLSPKSPAQAKADRLAALPTSGACDLALTLPCPLPLPPQDAHLWDVSVAPTLVMTQRGARRDFQRALRALGVEVVEFDFLTPDAVSRCALHFCC